MKFIRLRYGGNEIYVNMSLVSHIASWGGPGCAIYFVGTLQDEPLHLIVDETPADVISKLGATQ